MYVYKYVLQLRFLKKYIFSNMLDLLQALQITTFPSTLNAGHYVMICPTAIIYVQTNIQI